MALNFGIGGGCYIGSPVFLAKGFIRLTKLLSPYCFDTAFGYGDGRGESVLGATVGPRDTVITKWGTRTDWKPSFEGESRWASSQFSHTEIRAGFLSAQQRLGNHKKLFFLLHCPEPGMVDDHVREIINLRQDGLVAGVGFSVNDVSELLKDKSWADLIEAPVSALDKLTEFTGTLALHGVFKLGLSDRQLFEILSPLAANRVVIFSGSWRPWRLLGNWIQVRRMGKLLADAC